MKTAVKTTIKGNENLNVKESVNESDFVNRHLEQIPDKKEKALKLFEATKGNFYCDKCKGVTQGSTLCENISCPNMPCCDKPRETCKCEWGKKEKKL